MKKRIILGSIATVIIVVIAYLIIVFGPTDNSHVISMPSPAVDSGANINIDSISRAEVSPETVKAVLGTLARPESFSHAYTIKSYWDGGESESTLNYWQNVGNIRLSISQDNTVKNILIRGSDLYVWYDGSFGVLKSKLSESSISKEVDMFSRLVTYEEIMDISQENILDAYYIIHSGQPCVYVEYKSGELNYVYHIYISVDKGLLVSAEKYDAGKLIYSMQAASPELSTPSDDIFDIPS